MTLPAWYQMCPDCGHLLNPCSAPCPNALCPSRRPASLRQLAQGAIGARVRYTVPPDPPDFRSAAFDLVAHLQRQRDFSVATFGPGARTVGVIKHIRKELREVAASRGVDLLEWLDVAILAFDGALRAGFTPAEVAEGLARKQGINEARRWPDCWD